MYDKMQLRCYWPCMENDKYTIGQKCHSCVFNGSQGSHKRKLHLFPAVGRFEFVAIDILRASKDTPGNQHIVIILDQFLKQARMNPTAKITSPQMARMFLNNSVILYDMLNTY